MCKINGQKLGELRAKSGVSQRTLAKELGVTPGTISHYEKGVTEPSNEILDKICFFLKIDKNEIEVHNVGFDFAIGASKTVEYERKRLRKAGISRFANPIIMEAWVRERCALNEQSEIAEVNSALSNSFGIGKKKYILVSPTVIHIPEWQRDTDMAKTREIADNFDEDKFDPIKVYTTDDGKLKVADGAHRLIAFILNGEVKILSEFLDCKESEAVLTFLGQSAARKAMTVNDMYRAGVKANIEDYINMKHFFESRNIGITAESSELPNKIGCVRPSMTLFRMLRSDEEMLARVIELIKKLEWSGSERNVFTLRNMQVLKKLYLNFGKDMENNLLERCSGVSYYESKIYPIKSNAEMFDILSEEINRI